ncbi:hypothetical protein [Chryseobacterium indoltheticum]|uniref:hypothetical protein n=1 Tax=Chryseobacterium indoltheticum TaxID=254 RepID=UPI003F49376B
MYSTLSLETKIDAETAQVEFNKIKVVETGVANLNTNLQAKADKATVQEQIGSVSSNLQNKADKNVLENHVWSSDSHVSYLTRRDASNLD